MSRLYRIICKLFDSTFSVVIFDHDHFSCICAKVEQLFRLANHKSWKLQRKIVIAVCSRTYMRLFCFPPTFHTGCYILNKTDLQPTCMCSA